MSTTMERARHEQSPCEPQGHVVGLLQRGEMGVQGGGSRGALFSKRGGWLVEVSAPAR